MAARSFKILAVAAAAIILIGGAAFYFFQRTAATQFESPSAAPVATAQLAAPGRPNVMELASSADKDAACRAKLRQKGIVLQSGPCIDLDAVIEKLALGTYSFNKPTVGYVDEPFQVLLVLKTASDQDVKPYFENLPGSVQQRVAPTAQSLYASIRGADFAISPGGPQLRTFTSAAPLEWQWSVTPLKSGSKVLIIDVSADLVIEKEKTQVSLKVLREPIEIRVDAYRWLKSMMGEVTGIIALCAAAISGIFGLVAPVRRKFLWLFRRNSPPGEIDQ